jgi:malate synthase
MTIVTPAGMEIKGEIKPGYDQILTPGALDLVAKLSREFESRRQSLLAARVDRARRLDAGERPDFLPETAHIRNGDWKIAPIPKALECRRVEITGPVERKMVINAFNSGADSYMTDFEDSNRRTGTTRSPARSIWSTPCAAPSRWSRTARVYKLNDKVATLVVRPRGWHLDEKHVLVDGKRVSGGIFDFALFMFHNAKEQLARGAGPYFYLPKMESHLEARLWNDIFVMPRKTNSACRKARSRRPC